MHEEILADLVVMMYVKGSDGRGSGVPPVRRGFGHPFVGVGFPPDGAQDVLDLGL